MKNHNRNSSRNDIRSQRKKLLIRAVDTLLSDLYFYNISTKTDFYYEMLQKLKTQVVRACGDDAELTGDHKADAKILNDRYINEDFVSDIIRKYVFYRVKDKYDVKHIVECTNLMHFAEKLFRIKLYRSVCGLNFEYDVYCPCGEKTEYIGDVQLFSDYVPKYLKKAVEADRKRERFGEWVTGEYRCPACGNKCYTHMGTNIPFGEPADAKTRHLRHKIHTIMDDMYETSEQRKALYIELAYIIGVSVKDMHIGKLDKDQCIEVLDYLRNKHIYR